MRHKINIEKMRVPLDIVRICESNTPSNNNSNTHTMKSTKVIKFKGNKYEITDNGYLKAVGHFKTNSEVCDIEQQYIATKLKGITLVRFDIQTWYDRVNGNPYAAGLLTVLYKNGERHTIGQNMAYDDARNLETTLLRNYGKERLNGLSLTEYKLRKLVGRDFITRNVSEVKYRELNASKYITSLTITNDNDKKA